MLELVLQLGVADFWFTGCRWAAGTAPCHVRSTPDGVSTAGALVSGIKETIEILRAKKEGESSVQGEGKQPN